MEKLFIAVSIKTPQTLFMAQSLLMAFMCKTDYNFFKFIFVGFCENLTEQVLLLYKSFSHFYVKS